MIVFRREIESIRLPFQDCPTWLNRSSRFADGYCMHVTSSALHPSAAIAAGLRAQFQTQVLAQVFGEVGISQAGFSQALSTIAADGREVVDLGIEQARHDLLGEMLDVLV